MLSFLKSFFSFSLLVTPLIVIHELGHYWAARLFGVKVESFSIGFGAPLWSRTDQNGTQWKISIFPVGGYVKMLDGPQSRSRNVETVSSYVHNQSLDRKGSVEKVVIALAGPFMNYLFAFVALSLLLINIGSPVYDTHLGKIAPTSLAYKNGLRELDQVSEIQNRTVHHFSDIDKVLDSTSEKTSLSLQWTSPSGLTKTATFQPLSDQKTWKERLGLLPQSTPCAYQPLNWRDSLSKALEKISPRHLLKNIKISRFQGPVGISQGASQVISAGWIQVAYFMCALSIGLGFFNLLPLPILDGGMALFAVFEGICRKKISPYAQQIIQVMSFIAVALFFIIVSWNDISNLSIGKKIGQWFHK